MLWMWTGGSTGYGGNHGSDHLDAGARRATDAAVRGGAAHRRNWPPIGPHEECRHRQAAPHRAGTARRSAGCTTATQLLRVRGAELFVAPRPSGRRGFPLLRRPPASRQALLRRTRGDGLCAAKGAKRGKSQGRLSVGSLAPARSESAAALEAGHRAVEAVEGQREHAVLGDAADHSDACRAGPIFLRDRVEPYCPRIGLKQPAQPHLTRLVVPAFDAAAFLFDLVRAHARVADENDPVAPIVSADELHDRHLLDMAPSRIAPDRIIDAVVEVEVDQVLELRARGRKQLLANADVVLHRPADIEKQQQFHGVVTLRHKFQIEPAGVVRGRLHGAAEIELFGGTLARELPQPAQRQLDVAGAELDGIVEIAKLAAVPDLDRTAVAPLLLPDAHTFGVIPIGAEGRGAGGADPFAAALVAGLLLGEAPAQRLHQLFPAA